MQQQGNTVPQCMHHTDRPSRGIRLMMPADYTVDPMYPCLWTEDPPTLGDDQLDPTYDLGCQCVGSGFMSATPQPFPQYSPYALSWSPQSSGGFLPGVGGNINLAPGLDDIRSHRDAWLEHKDHGNFPRCGTNPGGPTHLTMNISMASSQVSFLHLSQEVCCYSVWKSHWY